MKQWLVIGLVWAAVLPVARAAEEGFSKTVRAEDFSAAGLAKLTPDELARLDALVRDYKGGASAAAAAMADKLLAARRAAEAAETARVAAETKAARAAEEAQAARAATAKAAGEKKDDEGLFARAKKVLVPAGTKVEVAAIESRIVGNFTGWEGKTIFTLENGQRWQVANLGSFYSPPIQNPKVTITPAGLGGYWLRIDELKQQVRVRPLGAER